MRTVFLAVMPFLVVCQTAGCAGSSVTGQQKPQASNQGEPKIEFVAPRNNDKFLDYPIHIKVKVTNFKLVPPVQYWGVVQPEESHTGHMHYSIDDAPVYATNKSEIVLSRNGDNYLPAGKHILRAELVHVNHESLKKPAVAEIVIWGKHGAPFGALGNKSAQVQLQKVQLELEHIEQVLAQLQNKCSGAQSPRPAVKNSRSYVPHTFSNP